MDPDEFIPFCEISHEQQNRRAIHSIMYPTYFLITLLVILATANPIAAPVNGTGAPDARAVDATLLTGVPKTDSHHLPRL